MRTVIAFAVSLTSESKPALVMFTAYRRSAPVVISIRSRSTVFGLARSSIAVRSLPAPIAFAKSSPVPDGKTARAAPVPTSPFAASDAVPSPPRAATILAPPSADSRARRSRSGPDSETRISCGTRNAWSPVVTSPITRPDLPRPAVGFATTTTSGASLTSGTRERGLLDDAGGRHRLGVVLVEARGGGVGQRQQILRSLEHAGPCVSFEVGRDDAEERGLPGEIDRGDELVPRGDEAQDPDLIEALVTDRPDEVERVELVGDLARRIRLGLELRGGVLRVSPLQPAQGRAEVGQDHGRPALLEGADRRHLRLHEIVPCGAGLPPAELGRLLLFGGALRPQTVREPDPAPEHEQPGDERGDQLDALPLRDGHRHGHRVAARCPERLPGSRLPFPLDRHRRPQRLSKRLTMIAPSYSRTSGTKSASIEIGSGLGVMTAAKIERPRITYRRCLRIVSVEITPAAVSETRRIGNSNAIPKARIVKITKPTYRSTVSSGLTKSPPTPSRNVSAGGSVR